MAGRVYVADAGNNRIQIFNPGGTYSATLSTGKGAGDYQFNSPYGVALDSANNVYVADRFNHRVQVYDSSRAWVATLGVTGVAGSDNAHFWEPYDVAVNTARNIYVVDRRNHRVQVFDSNLSYVRTIGVTAVAGSDFGHLSNPIAVAVDRSGRTYVTDQWGARVQVFDAAGAYLTTIGGAGGSRSGDTRQIEGLALDSNGDLYAADLLNHRVQKYALGTPGWRQSNLKGFGDRQNSDILSLAAFGGQLYAGTHNSGGNGAQLWWRATEGAWTPVMTNGFGITRNVGLDHLAEFGGRLYAGTWADSVNGGEVWRSGDGIAWTQVVSGGFGDTTNGEVFRFAVFSDTLFAGTWSYYTPTHSAEIWRSRTGDAGDWTRVAANGFDGDSNNMAVLSFAPFDGFLYAGTWNVVTGGEVWRSPDGVTWGRVNADGFGTPNNRGVSALAVFDGHLYAGTIGKFGVAGVQAWRCRVCDGSDWTKVVDNGFGNPSTNGMSALEVFAGRLYLVGGNSTAGVEVWRSRTGNAGEWEQVGFAGFGDSNNWAPYWSNSVTAFENRLFVGTQSAAYGGEVWQETVRADFIALPTSGPAPLTVAFTNTSTGGYTASRWDFGDGITGTLPSPSHTYTVAGSYTVTLTVSDGVDTNTVVRPAYVQVQSGGTPGPGVAISLSTGWNLVSLTFSPTVPYRAGDLVESTRQQGITVTHLARWQNGAWQSYIPGFGPENFPLEFGQGYFVRTTGPGRWLM